MPEKKTFTEESWNRFVEKQQKLIGAVDELESKIKKLTETQTETVGICKFIRSGNVVQCRVAGDLPEGLIGQSKDWVSVNLGTVSEKMRPENIVFTSLQGQLSTNLAKLFVFVYTDGSVKIEQRGGGTNTPKDYIWGNSAYIVPNQKGGLFYGN